MRHFQNILTKQTMAIAVDFAADALRCIAIERAADGTWTRRVAFELPTVLLDRSMEDSAVREFSAKVSEAGLTGCNCHVTIASNLFRMDIAQFPNMNEQELAASARFEAHSRFNVNAADVMIQHAPLPCKAPGRCALLLMAVPLLIIRNATQAVMAAGLSPCSIENAACAALHGAELRHDGLNSGLITFMHIEPQQAVLLLMKDGQLQFVRAMQGDWAAVAGAQKTSDNQNSNSIALEPVQSGGAWRWSSLAEETLRCLRQNCEGTSWPTRIVVSGAPSSDHELLETLKGVCGIDSTSVDSAGWSVGNEKLKSDTWAAALGAASLDFKNISSARAA
ncbi:MAG: hypothetical protein EXS12_01595 [Phycisphaerales bacterium]|nr:hypothetical protein [Phycisphaerales bacterium]